ncbi:hypothetical protein [Nocardia nova]|uniref:hypothetical protein n=1 Tax=Nocardia nova TaxID=37330 RepID=UPI000CEA1E04|nr:hypothetical protein [Nocardia nova]PPJ29454.1 hypothetical protein C5E41_10625 [Nocardia nova]
MSKVARRRPHRMVVAGRRCGSPIGRDDEAVPASARLPDRLSVGAPGDVHDFLVTGVAAAGTPADRL